MAISAPGAGQNAYTGKASLNNKVTMSLVGLKEIQQMFNELPKQVNKDTIWGRFWRQATKELVKQAQAEAPLLGDAATGGSGDVRRSGKIGVPYPPNKNLTISRGTLKRSIGLFRTKASKGDIHGAYIGPRVKGKFSKNKGGYYGAWVEYGNEVMHFGKYKSKGNKFMHRAWSKKKHSVMNKGIELAEKIFEKAIKDIK